MTDLLVTTDQKVLAQIQYRLDDLIAAQSATQVRLGELLGAVERLRVEVGRPRTHEVVRDAQGDIVRTIVT